MFSVVDLGAQRLSITPYLGLEGEAVTTTQNIIVEDMEVDGDATAVIDLTFGLRTGYRISDRLTVNFDINRRTTYLFGFLIRHPEVAPFFRGTKAGTVGGNDWMISVAPHLTILSTERFRLSVLTGLGFSRIFPFAPAVNGRKGMMNFGPGYESLTALYNLLEAHPIRTVAIGTAGFIVQHRRFSLQVRYIKTLSRSLTEPFTFNGRTYPYVNRRNTLQLMIGYTIPFGRRKAG